MGCLDLFLVYVIFSWLRGIVHASFDTDPTFTRIVTTTIENTFFFHQGPWYLAALIMWRCSSFFLWQLPFLAALTLALLLAATCPYKALAAAQDPLALREFLHYLPFFVVGLCLGQDGLQRITRLAGDRSTLLAVAILATLAFLVWFPLGFLYGDKDLMWVLLMKGVPPAAAGGVLAMLVLYAVKLVATVCALTLFSAESWGSLDRVFEAAGQRSMIVYMVHMVFVMVPGEDLCVREYMSLFLSNSVAIQAILLLVVAVAVNLLCGSSFTDMFFRPLVEPLKYMNATRRSWQHDKAGGDEEERQEQQALVAESQKAQLFEAKLISSTPTPETARW
jgi:hypothetical protein